MGDRLIANLSNCGQGPGIFTPEELLVLSSVGRSEDVAEPSVLLIEGDLSQSLRPERRVSAEVGIFGSGRADDSGDERS